MLKAVKTLLRRVSSENENISVRASESIIEYALRSIECDELESRIAALEERSQGGK